MRREAALFTVSQGMRDVAGYVLRGLSMMQHACAAPCSGLMWTEIDCVIMQLGEVAPAGIREQMAVPPESECVWKTLYQATRDEHQRFI